jgi:hypothetical protein
LLHARDSTRYPRPRHGEGASQRLFARQAVALRSATSTTRRHERATTARAVARRAGAWGDPARAE